MKKKKTQWFYNRHLKPLGPFSEADIREKIQRGEIGPHDLIADDSGEWRDAILWNSFEYQLFPASQKVLEEMDQGMNIQEWVLLVHQNLASEAQGLQFAGLNSNAAYEKAIQVGPFSILELREMIRVGKVSPYSYIWKSGLSGWCQVKDRSEFRMLMTSDRLISE